MKCSYLSKTQLVTCFHCLYSSFLSEIVGEICKNLTGIQGKVGKFILARFVATLQIHFVQNVNFIHS
jgi:hypothetical protein